MTRYDEVLAALADGHKRATHSFAPDKDRVLLLQIEGMKCVGQLPPEEAHARS